MKKLTLAILMLALIPAIYVAGAFDNAYFGAATFLTLVGIYFKLSLRQVPKVPSDDNTLTKGIVTFLGKHLNWVIGQGLHILPFSKLGLFDCIEVPGQDLGLELPLTGMRTPDGVPNSVPVTIRYRFDDEKPLAYVKAGGQKGVERLLGSYATQGVRWWIEVEDLGPRTWKELRAAGDSAIDVILKSILRNEIPRIPSNIPTEYLMRYFAGQKPNASELNDKRWVSLYGGENWEGLKYQLETLSSEDQQKIKTAIAERRRYVTAAAQGTANLRKGDLGVIIEGVTLGDIRPIGEFAKQVDNVAEAEIAARVENVRLTNLNNRLGELQKTLGNSSHALAAAGIAKININEEKKTFDPPTVAAIKEAVIEVAKLLFGHRKSSEKEA